MDERIDFEALSAAAVEGSAERTWTDAVDKRLAELDRRLADVEQRGDAAPGVGEHLLQRWEDFSRRLQIIVAVLEATDERLLDLVEHVLVDGSVRQRARAAAAARASST